MGRISMPQGKGSIMHNTRDYAPEHWPEHIDRNRSAENVEFKNEKLSAAYERIFGEAVKEYNEKQKRADRKINDYMQHIRNSKNGEKLFYEDVLQWGTMDDFKNKPELREVAKDCLQEYISTFEQRNPNLELVGAYIHMDEASPHLHFDYIPVADGYKNGLPIRNSLSKAMQQMGFSAESKKENETKKWKNREREYFAEICREHGLQVEKEVPTPERDSLSVAEYKVARDKMIGTLENERNQIASQVNSLANAARRLSDPERTEPVEVAGKMFTPIPELARRSERAEEELKGLEDMIEQQKGALARLKEEINRFLQLVEKLLDKMVSIFKKGIDAHDPEVIEDAREQFNQDYLFAPFDDRVKNAYKSSVMDSADKLKNRALNRIQKDL